MDKYHLKDLYVDALIEDIKYNINKHVDKDNYIETIFIGGGTPSTLSVEHYKKIFDLLKPYLTYIKEITIESNPNSVSLEWLKKLRKFGINRVSFGVQSFRDDKLKFLGRNHSEKRAIKAIQEAKEAGFEHINLDIIYGCELDTKENMLRDINIAKSLPVDHISAYSLTIEEDTKFFHTPQVKIDDFELSGFIFDAFEKAGFHQYEISNFAKSKTSKSKHNYGYWEYKEYLGCGSGAVGRIKKQRLYKEKSIEEYIKNPTIYSEIEELSDEDMLVEKVLLGLRSDVGVDIDLLNDEQKNKLKELLKEDKIKQIGNKIYASDYLIADELALYLL